MNLAALRDQVRTRTNTSSTDATLDAATINAFINSANLQIASDADWPWRQTSTTFSTVAGTDTYTPPTDWLRTKSLKVANENPMRLLSIIDLDQRWYDSTGRGLPREYAIEADQIVIRPIPDGIYVVTHRYVKVEPILDTDDDIPLMPAQFQFAIVELAAYLGHRRMGNTNDADVALSAYKEWRNRMVSEHTRTMVPKRVRVRPGSML